MSRGQTIGCRGEPVSDVVAELARVREAFERPTLTLLHKPQAALVLTVFRTAFGRDMASVPADRLHTQVDVYLGELRQIGQDAPKGTGRDLCRKWMREQWLTRYEDDGGEVYTLTSHAQAALSLVNSLMRDRVTLSEHRINTIRSAFRYMNTVVNPDRAARVALLNDEIVKLERERDRLVNGGELELASDDTLLEGFVQLLTLIGDLPGEFKRVEEAYELMRREIMASFRLEERPIGEVIDDYLRRTADLMTATPQGRAFEGAFALLRDDVLLQELHSDIRDLLEHPRAASILSRSDRVDLRSTVEVIRGGIDGVLEFRSRLTRTLREQIVNQDIDRNRALSAVLRQLDSELVTWVAGTNSQARVPLDLLPQRPEVHHLKLRFYDPANDVPPPPLTNVAPDGDLRAPSLEELRAQGGPTFPLLRTVLVSLQSLWTGDEAAGRARSVGEAFNELPADDRRPVEVLGLLHLLMSLDPDVTEHGYEQYDAVLPGGPAFPVMVPRIVADPGGATPIEALPQLVADGDQSPLAPKGAEL
jgi:hypothetical protein